MIIAELCNYAADYGGNFMASLKSIEKHARTDNPNNQVIYVFPQSAKEKEWISDLRQNNKVLFLSDGQIQGNLDLLRWCKYERIDVLHVHFYGLVTGCFVGWLSKTIVIHHFHNTWEKSGMLKTKALKLFSKSADKLVGCSKAVYDSLAKAKFTMDNTLYITNCIDFTRLDIVKDHNPFKNDKNNILILGTDFYRKGVNYALKAIGGIQAVYNLQLNIITHQFDKSEELIKQEIGYFPDWISLIHPVENIGDYYRSSKLFLSPSLAEGLCYAIPEALYCGCMVLKTNIPSMDYELIGEEFITLKSIEELRQRIEAVFNNEIDCISVRINLLRDQVKRKYSVDKWGEEVFSLYKELVNS